MARVSIRNVSKIYHGEKSRDLRALRDVSLEIADREFVVFLGPTGCGKSTVLRLVAGLERVSSGEIFIGEKQVNDLAPKNRDVAMVFQEDALYPQMSVFGNLAFGLKLRKYSPAEIKNRVADAARILGIENLLERKSKTLSAEQRVRIALGRAIVRRAKVFLFDEPLATLESATRQSLRREIAQLHQRLEGTLIYAASDPVEAMTIADRIVLLNEGAVEQEGAPRDLYDAPANLFVAGFLSRAPMNLIHGTLKADGEKIRFCEKEGGTVEVDFAASARPGAAQFIGKPIILGIRPEDLVVAPKSNEGKAAANGLPAIVDLVEPMGGETRLHLQTGAHTLICQSREGFDHRHAGHRFYFEINVQKAHLFDPISARRID
jgi:multiple sugar transport system ATP-binding protein